MKVEWGSNGQDIDQMPIGSSRKCSEGCQCRRHTWTELHRQRMKEMRQNTPLTEAQLTHLKTVNIDRTHTDIARQNMRTSHLGKPRPEETRQAIRIGKLGKPGTPHTEEAKRRIGENAAKRIAENSGPWKDTKPELEMKHRLQERGIAYEHQKYIEGMCVDFYLPGQNQIIEVDGCWYHGCPDCFPNGGLRPDRFSERRQKLEALGYNIIRIWEHELGTRGIKTEA